MESVELGGDCGDRGNGGGSLVSGSSGEWRSSSGTTAPAVPGRREDVREVRDEVAVRVEELGGRGVAHRRRKWRRTEVAAARCERRGRELRWVLG